MPESPPGAAPNARVRIAVDCMGGDHGPAVTLPACHAFLAAHPQAEIRFGVRESLNAFGNRHSWLLRYTLVAENHGLWIRRNADH